MAEKKQDTEETQVVDRTQALIDFAISQRESSVRPDTLAVIDELQQIINRGGECYRHDLKSRYWAVIDYSLSYVSAGAFGLSGHLEYTTIAGLIDRVDVLPDPQPED